MRKARVERAALVAALCLPWPAQAIEAHASFRDAGTEDRRPLAAADLVRLGDIGPVQPAAGEHIFAISPDGKRAAVQLRTADPGSNSYDIRIIVFKVERGGQPITVDQGGEFIRQMVDGVGGARVSTGYAAAVPLRWSPDGRWIYFLKRQNGSTQVWRADTSGAGSERLTNEPVDVEQVLIASNGRKLIYSINQKDPAVTAAREAEALEGFRYDARFIPIFSSGPDAFPSTKRRVRTLDLTSKVAKVASSADEAELDAIGRQTADGPVAVSRDGRRALAPISDDPRGFTPVKIVAQDAGHRDLLCLAAACAGVSNLWWTPDGNAIRYIRRAGWGDSEVAFYEWKPGTGKPRRLYTTPDLLLDCQPVDQRFLCAREQSSTPRQIILVDPGTGRSQVVYDPNPGFRYLTLGRVERLKWTNSFGVETFGDLVYPTNYKPGQKSPLIVVQYTSRGFLRGGVGDEFPIQLFANKGYAVLSVQRPSARHLVGTFDSAQDYERKIIEGFKDRRSVLSAIETAVRSLIDRGIVDADRVGITGLSDGSSTVQFAAVNSTMFKVGSVSGCCWEPFQDGFVGPGAAAAFHRIGWPRLVDYNSEFWSHLSLIGNARKISMPLLMQQSDDELRGAVSSYTALEQAGKPVALYVFPNEHHVKWQPAHRLAAYERNLRWFDFWLLGIGKLSDWQPRDWQEKMD